MQEFGNGETARDCVLLSVKNEGAPSTFFMEELIMRDYCAKSLNNIFKVVAPALLIFFSFNSICFSQEINVDAPAVEPSIAALKDEQSYDSGAALRKIKDARAVEPLILALKDENDSIRWSAADALGEIKDARAVEPLIAALKDKNNYVQWNAADALGKIKDVRAVEPLIAALKDAKNITFRSKATTALGKMKDARVVEPLILALKDENADVRRSAADALGEVKGVRSVEPLIAALKDENDSVRSSAADALGEIKDVRDVEPLVAALKDKNNVVRRKAANALISIGAPAVEFLIAALKDENLELIAGTYPFFIQWSASGSEALLIKALDKYGDITMMEDFLNCGNSQLVVAGTNWAKEHRHTIVSDPDKSFNGPRWGSNN